MNILVDLEKKGWQALSSAGNEGRRFYAAVLREDAVMLLPGGLILKGRDNILKSLGDKPWQSFCMERDEIIELSENVSVVIYLVTAQRADSPEYKAVISSTYILDGDSWKLAVHQQTPV